MDTDTAAFDTALEEVKAEFVKQGHDLNEVTPNELKQAAAYVVKHNNETND